MMFRKLAAALLAAVMPLTSVAAQNFGAPLYDITADDSHDWGVALKGDYCAGHMQTGDRANHTFGLSLRYNETTYAGNWWATFEVGDGAWGSQPEVESWAVGLDLLGGGAAFASGKARIPRSNRGSPTDLGLFQNFPWDDRIHSFDRLDIRIQAPKPNSRATLLQYSVYRAPKANEWISKIETCAAGLLVDRTYRRYPANQIRLTLGRQQYLPETVTVKACETVFVLPGGRKLRYTTGSGVIRTENEGETLVLGGDASNLLVSPNPARPISLDELRTLSKVYAVQQSACLRAM